MNLSMVFRNSTSNVLTLVLFGIFLSTIPAHSQTKESRGQTDAKASILSHFVHHGLSQTNKDPSLQTSIMAPIGPQFRFGIWGSNVSYEGGDNHITIRFPFEIKLDFNKDVNLMIGYSVNQYFKSRTRDGNTTSLKLDVFEYMIIHELESNWEGTETKSKYFAFAKDFKMGGDYIWENQLGYTVVSVENLQNYFDLKTGIAGKYDKLVYKFTVTATSSPSQFNGRGDAFGIFSLGFSF